MSDEVEAPKPPGLPAWVMTFADLMSLLMCFFVLLLSFSQMDLSKFKKVAGSMERAFGVQRDIVTYEPPKGTSIIAQEFSPGKPMPTNINEVRQKTVQEIHQTLEFDEVRTNGKRKQRAEFQNPNVHKLAAKKEDTSESTKEEITNKLAKELAKALAHEIVEGMIEVEAYGQRIVIRILEKGSFESGDDELNYAFGPIMQKISGILKNIPGKIRVNGHTDNIPIYTNRFRSNWELSVARATAVVHKLLEYKELDPKRFMVSGFADTEPLFKNDNKMHQKQNRRVEIIISQGDDPSYKAQSDLDKSIDVEKQNSRIITEDLNTPDN